MINLHKIYIERNFNNKTARLKYGSVYIFPVFMQAITNDKDEIVREKVLGQFSVNGISIPEGTSIEDIEFDFEGDAVVQMAREPKADREFNNVWVKLSEN